MILLLLACDEPPVSACPSWSGLGLETRTWTYSAFGEGGTYEVLATATALDEFLLTSPDYDAELTCEASGLVVRSEHRITEALEAWWDYDPPALWMPASLEPGTAWSLGSGYAYHDSTGLVETRSDDTQFAVVGATEQHVTAGGFDTLEVQVLDGAEGDTRYYADGVGLVLDGTAQLVAVD